MKEGWVGGSQGGREGGRAYGGAPRPRVVKKRDLSGQKTQSEAWSREGGETGGGGGAPRPRPPRPACAAGPARPAPTSGSTRPPATHTHNWSNAVTGQNTVPPGGKKTPEAGQKTFRQLVKTVQAAGQKGVKKPAPLAEAARGGASPPPSAFFFRPAAPRPGSRRKPVRVRGGW